MRKVTEDIVAMGTPAEKERDERDIVDAKRCRDGDGSHGTYDKGECGKLAQKGHLEHDRAKPLRS